MIQNAALTDSEWVLIQIIWENQPCTLRSICNEVNKKHAWSRHAVISFLKRMETKKTIAVQEASPHKLYRALISKEETVLQEAKDVLDRAFEGNPMLMVSYLANDKAFSEEELEELVQILRNGKEAQHDATDT